MIAMLLSSCPLYGLMPRGEDQPTGPILGECRSRKAVLLKTLFYTIGDDGWTPMGIDCSLQMAPSS